MPRGIYKRRPPEELFWEKVEKRGPQECWPWLGLKFRGYGQLKANSKHFIASRFSFALANGGIDPALMVLHSCDNRSCVNPAHLRQGTAADNARDSVERSRRAVGERHPMAKLSSGQVVEMRGLHGGGMAPSAIALRFGVSKAQTNKILNGSRWKSVLLPPSENKP